MEWSTLLNRVTLLSGYIGPEPEVSTLVREQLTTDAERATIRKAVAAVMGGVQKMETPYDIYLRRTNLNIVEIVMDIGIEPLAEAMFDLNLGDRVKRLQLNRFSDVHEVRECVEWFVSRWRSGMVGGHGGWTIWWDGIDPSFTPHAHWLSKGLEEDPDFYTVFGRWQDESDRLQRWLDDLESSPAVVNNVASGMDTIFSANMALTVMALAGVRCSRTWVEQQLIQTADAGGSYGREEEKRLCRQTS